MREIKFRMWDTTTKMISTWDELLSRADDGYPCGLELLNYERFVIMQYTGLKDKNGKEIYESDYLKTNKEIICRVYWSKSGASFMVAYGNKWSDKIGKLIYKTLRNFHSKSEVIGNIYENELLK